MGETSANAQRTPRQPVRRAVAEAVEGALVLGAVVLAVGVVFALLVAFLRMGGTINMGSDDAAAGSSPRGRTIRIGTTEGGKDSWDAFTVEAKKQGIDLATVNFSSYQQPDDALAQGQINVNLFQHLRFLAEYNIAHNTDLTPVASTYIVPLSLYSKKHKTLAEIPRGGQIVIPNDPSNQSRALFVLRSAGLITLVGDRLSPTANDVDKAASKVAVVLVDPAQTARSLDSVDGAVVNNTYLSDVGIDPRTALAKDDPGDPSSAQYINVLVVRAADKDDPVYQKLAAIYHCAPVQDAYNTESKGTQVSVTKTPAELGRILAGIETKLRAGQ